MEAIGLSNQVCHPAGLLGRMDKMWRQTCHRFAWHRRTGVHHQPPLGLLPRCGPADLHSVEGFLQLLRGTGPSVVAAVRH
jgi:hypothetical protein